MLVLSNNDYEGDMAIFYCFSQVFMKLLSVSLFLCLYSHLKGTIVCKSWNSEMTVKIKEIVHPT